MGKTKYNKQEDKTWFWRLTIITISFVFFIVLMASRSLRSNTSHQALSCLKPTITSERFYPPTLKSLIIHPHSKTNYFDFIIDTGDNNFQYTSQLRPHAKELINYFFLGITLPSDDFWVNLNSVRQNEITNSRLALTDVGKILLQADLRLKKDACRFTDPRHSLGKEYWDKLQTRLSEQDLINPQLPIGNRFWIIPAEAVVEENKNKVTIVKSKLKVCLEQECLSLQNNTFSLLSSQSHQEKQAQDIADQTMKEVILPTLEYEVNYGKAYAPLRQVYNSLILAEYFKQKYWGREGLYPHLVNQSYINGLESKEPWSKDNIFNAYVRSCKEGEYRFSQTEYDPYQAAMVQKYYFYGGVILDKVGQILEKIRNTDSAAVVQVQVEDFLKASFNNSRFLVKVFNYPTPQTQIPQNPWGLQDMCMQLVQGASVALGALEVVPTLITSLKIRTREIEENASVFRFCKSYL